MECYLEADTPSKVHRLSVLPHGHLQKSPTHALANFQESWRRPHTQDSHLRADPGPTSCCPWMRLRLKRLNRFAGGFSPYAAVRLIVVTKTCFVVRKEARGGTPKLKMKCRGRGWRGQHLAA